MSWQIDWICLFVYPRFRSVVRMARSRLNIISRIFCTNDI